METDERAAEAAKAEAAEGAEAEPAEDDASLMRRVAARDRVASGMLFDRYAEQMHGFLARTATPAEADDLLQEVFTRALRGASRYRGDASVRTWLYAIARHTVLERRRARFAGETLDDLTFPGRGPESLVMDAERQREIVSALEHLPDDQAIVLSLHRVKGLSHPEIAQLLGIRPATSRKRLERAVIAVRQLLSGEGGEIGRGRHRRIDSWGASLQRRLVPEGGRNDEPGRA